MTAKADGKRVKVVGTVRQVNTEDGGVIRILTVKSFEVIKPPRDPGDPNASPDMPRRNADEAPLRG